MQRFLMTRPHSTWLLALFLLLGAAVPVAAQDADAVLGLWQTEPTDQGYAIIRITREQGSYQGEIVSLSEPLFAERAGLEWAGKEKVDRNNPDASKQGAPIVGLKIVWGFGFKKGRWEGGRIYDPENGKTYKAKMTMNDDGSLAVRGFIGFSALGRTTTWQRADRNPQ